MLNRFGKKKVLHFCINVFSHSVSYLRLRPALLVLCLSSFNPEAVYSVSVNAAPGKYTLSPNKTVS